MEKAYKYRIYPNKKQKELIAKTFGCCRFIYNVYLAKRIKIYEESKKSFSCVQCASDMKNLKTELQWLKEVDSTALQSSLKDLDSAYQNFLRNAVGIQNSSQRKFIDILISQNALMEIFNTVISTLNYLNLEW